MSKKVYVEFATKKVALLTLLDNGVVIKSQWDAAIKQAEELGMIATLSQLGSYYLHYNIGEMGKLEGAEVLAGAR